jgi:predicted dienelactone hydrolase
MKRSFAVVTLISAIALMACFGTESRGASIVSVDSTPPTAPLGRYEAGLTHMTFKRPSSSKDEMRVMETAVWFPADAQGEPDADGAPYPIVMFSHGDSGSPDQAAYLTEELARSGYIVVAPSHPGNTHADCWFACSTDSRVDAAINRVPDLNSALDQFLARRGTGDPVADLADADTVVASGFSFGGWTALSALQSGRYDAAVTMAAAIPEALVEAAPAFDVPVLMFGGGHDEVISPAGLQSLFDAMPASSAHYFAFLPNAHHTSFQDVCIGCEAALTPERGHEIVAHYAPAFLDAVLRGDVSGLETMRENPFPELQLTYRGPE